MRTHEDNEDTAYAHVPATADNVHNVPTLPTTTAAALGGDPAYPVKFPAAVLKVLAEVLAEVSMDNAGEIVIAACIVLF